MPTKKKAVELPANVADWGADPTHDLAERIGMMTESADPPGPIVLAAAEALVRATYRRMISTTNPNT